MLNCDRFFTAEVHSTNNIHNLREQLSCMYRKTSVIDCCTISLADYFVLMKITIPAVLFVALCVFMYLKRRRKTERNELKLPTTLPMLKRDMTLKELQQYDGTGADKRILIGLNGNIYDVTAGRRQYGPGMPFEMFAGQNLTFRDWEKIISFAYYKVGKVIYTKLNSSLSGEELSSPTSLNIGAKKRRRCKKKIKRHGLIYCNEEELTPLTFDDEFYDLDLNDSPIITDYVDQKLNTTVETVKYRRLLNETEV